MQAVVQQRAMSSCLSYLRQASPIKTAPTPSEGECFRNIVSLFGFFSSLAAIIFEFKKKCKNQVHVG